MTITIECPACGEEQDITLTTPARLCAPEYNGFCRACKVPIGAQQINLSTVDVWNKESVKGDVVPVKRQKIASSEGSVI